MHNEIDGGQFRYAVGFLRSLERLNKKATATQTEDTAEPSECMKNENESEKKRGDEMAHIEKCKGTKAGALIKHDERAQGTKDEHIDPALRHLNYNLCERGDSIGYMNSRISEIMKDKTLRKDAVKAISLIVTCPQDLPEQEQEKFLRAAYDFAEKEYGKENIISAWVHRDEPGAMPHIHIKAVPAVIDKETGKEKLSAKSLITRAYLKQLHPKLQKYIEAKLGHPVSIINGATAEKNKEIAELKADALKKEITKIEKELQPIRAEFEARKEYVREMEKDYNLINGVKANKSITGKVKSYDVPATVWETQQVTQMDRNAHKRAQERWEQLIKDYPEIIKENAKLWEANEELAKTYEKMSKEINKVNATLQKMSPEAQKEFWEHFSTQDAPERAQEPQDAPERQDEDERTR